MTRDPLVIFTPSGKRGRFPAGTPVLTAARQLGVDLNSVCGGRGICSKCQVTPAFGDFPKHGITATPAALSPFNAVEERYDRIRGLAPGRRLGCQAQLLADAVIDVPPESQVHKQVVRKRAEARAITLDPATRLYYVEVAEPDMHEPSGDLQRLERALAEQWQLERRQGRPAHPADAPARPAQGRLEGHLRRPLRRPRAAHPPRLARLLRRRPSTASPSTSAPPPSPATSATSPPARCMASTGLMNPQIRFGEDLMSRVSYAMMNPGGAAEMTRAVRAALNDLAGQAAAEAGIARELIFEAVIVGNPIMHHLVLGIDPTELGQAPFALATADALNLWAEEIELRLHQDARIYILPCIAGHVGADAAAVALSEAPDRSEELMLVVDVGTNAEILLGNRDRVLACSSPTGPAFEGAQNLLRPARRPRRHRARRDRPRQQGAPLPRHRLRRSGPTTPPSRQRPVTGICGSGIIEVIAEMRAAGLVDASGLIGSAEQTGTDRLVPQGRTHAYRLHGDILVTQGDVRAIQLAKSALYAGARLLMDEFDTDTVGRIVLAGAFGAHISPRHAMILGMIPDCDLARVTSAGNAAGTGARIALLNVAARREVEDLVTRIHKVETAIEPRFQEHFVAANAIPHATAPFPHLDAAARRSFNADGGRRRQRVR